MDRASIFGNYRAKVVDNKDKQMFGRVLIWIPDVMPEVSEDQGIWARPANNPLGGRNMENDEEHHFMGTSYIPKIGSWLFVFFEGGNINRPYYFGALDLENTKVLPENQLGSNYEDKWTVFKSHEGRVIVVSDDPDDERIEIGGKKRKMTDPPTGDTDSVYEIDENMTTILFDERDDKQKILIRTYLGDFIHIDIDERKLQAEFESDIIIKTNGSFYLTAKKDIHIVSEDEDINLFTEKKDINIRAEKKDIKLAALEDIHITSIVGDINIDATSSNINVVSGNDMFNTAGGSFNVIAQNDHVVQSGSQMSRRAGTSHDTDAGTNVNVQSGTSKAAKAGSRSEVAEEAEYANPKGERKT
jgi:hypothetical protein